jgi:hypothetical protein
MSLIRWSRPLLAAALVLVGCKSKPAPESPPAATPGPTTQAPPPAPAPATGPAIAYLKEIAFERCALGRQPLPSGEPSTVFTFDAACSRSMLSWNAAGNEVLVFSFATTATTLPQLWRVDAAAKTGKPLELKGLPVGGAEGSPYRASVRHAGFDAQGRPVALVAIEYDAAEGGTLSFEGESFPLPKGEGAPGLVAAYRWEGSEWKRFETKTNFFSEHDGTGVEQLDAAKAVAPSNDPPSDNLPGQEAQAGAAEKLNAATANARAGKWMSLSTPGGPLYYRGVLDEDDDSHFSSAPVRWEHEGKLVEPEGLAAQDDATVYLRLRGDLLLVTVLAEGGRAAHAYDLKTKKKLASVTDINSATFWPTPSKP